MLLNLINHRPDINKQNKFSYHEISWNKQDRDKNILKQKTKKLWLRQEYSEINLIVMKCSKTNQKVRLWQKYSEINPIVIKYSETNNKIPLWQKYSKTNLIDMKFIEIK